MKSKIKTVCVYGGASDKVDKSYIDGAKKVGNLLVEKGLGIVYGAGASGVMGAVARGVDAFGGHIIGISPDFIEDFEPVYECDVSLKTKTMSDRKDMMEDFADMFLILPGGIGTMDEFFQVLTLKQLKRHNKPIVVYNFDGFYDKLIELIDSFVDKMFLKDIYDDFVVVSDIKELSGVLDNYVC